MFALQNQKTRNKQTQNVTKDTKFIEAQVSHYLYSHTLVKKQNQESIQNFLISSSIFDLNLSEKMQIINICPTTLVEIFLIVDGCNERLGKEKSEELLELIMTTLYVEENV